MMRIFAAICLASLGWYEASAGELTVHVGPPATGNGGTNPVSVPPVNFVEYEVQWVTASGFESNIAVTPGLLFGGRSKLGNNFYVAMGGGFVLDANGGGPGVYSSLGYTGPGTTAFNAEFKQALGYDTEAKKVVSPYAIRVGLSFIL